MTEFSDAQVEMLNANLDGSKVKERAGFSYLEGWWAASEANRIFGHGNWTHEIVRLDPAVTTTQGVTNYTSPATNTRPERHGYLVAFTATVRVTVGDQFHDGAGYGEGIDYNNAGQAYESAVKEAETDAMKRALKNWGNPFGLALYDKDQVNVNRVPSDKGHGICAIHEVPYSQSDKQKAAGFAPSHKDGEGWCVKPASGAQEPRTAPTGPPPVSEANQKAVASLEARFGEGKEHQAERIAFIQETLAPKEINHPNEITDDEWDTIREAAESTIEDDAAELDAQADEHLPSGKVEDLPF